ncbi:unnamed protein product [Calypogeia fissa]
MAFKYGILGCLTMTTCELESWVGAFPCLLHG